MPELRVTVDGRSLDVPRGTTVAAAIARAGTMRFHLSTGGEPRAPLCGMGICFECRVRINGRPYSLSCQTLCEEGMDVVTT